MARKTGGIVIKDYLNYLRLSQQYLITSQLILQELRKNRNVNYVVSDKEIKDEEFWEITKWSDSNTLTPALFILRHGMELLVKGLSGWAEIEHPKNHHVEDMLKIIKNDKRFKDDLIKLISLYVGSGKKQALLQKFGDNNKLKNLDSSLNEALRYPALLRENKEVDFSSLLCQQSIILPDIDNIIDDIENILREASKMVFNVD